MSRQRKEIGFSVYSTGWQGLRERSECGPEACEVVVGFSDMQAEDRLGATLPLVAYAPSPGVA